MRFVIAIVVATFGVTAPSVRARADEHGDVGAVVEIQDSDATTVDVRAAGHRAPPVAAVLEAAYAAAALDRDPTRSWRRRARVAGIIPWITVRTGWDANWRDEKTDVGRSRTFEVRATWRLDRLLFDGRELQMSSIDAARRRERRRLASRVIQAYFAWRKATARAAQDGRFALSAEAATAELDALTDGWLTAWFTDRANSAR